MTIQEALDRIDIMRPNMLKKEFKIAALSEVDGLIYREIILNHEDEERRLMTPGEQIIFLSPEMRTHWMTPEMREAAGITEEESQEQGFTGYTMETDPGTELLVKFPYDELYTWWLASKVDWQNMEIDKYNNDRTLFNNAYDTFSDWYTRNHMPKQRTREFRI